MTTPAHCPAPAASHLLAKLVTLMACACVGLTSAVLGQTSTSRAPDSQRTPPISGRAVIQQMHDAFANRWYRTLAFDQHNTAYDSAGAETHSEWHEFAATPGRLRMDYEPADRQSGAVIRADSAYSFARGQLKDVRPYIEPFAILLSDVYILPPERSAHVLDSLGFALSVVHEGRWDGHDVIVVGATAADSISQQFWVDRHTWLVVRVIQTEKQHGAPVTTDVHVVQRAAPPSLPVETELLFLENGHRVWREQYSNVRVDPALPDSLFDPSRFVKMIGFRAPPGR